SMGVPEPKGRQTAAGPTSKRQSPGGGPPAPRELPSLPPESPQPESIPLRRRYLWIAAPSWLISLLVHLALILILAAITLTPLQRALSIIHARASSSEVGLEQFELQGPVLDPSAALDEPLSIPTPSISQIVQMPELATPRTPTPLAAVDALDSNRLTESIMPSALLNSSAMAQMATSLTSRSSANRGEMLERFGGSAASEKSVALALKWIAAHQAPNGGWTFAHSSVCRNQCGDPGDMVFATNGATAMALLPFLGAGQTHLEGQYQETVHRGLAYLIDRMQVTSGPQPTGSWHEPGGRMYSHSLAAITVCEAYAMTRDPDLLQPAQLSLNYLSDAQDKRGGGWRYEPGQAGDTSVVGWCVMALKSGKMGNLVVPNSTFQGASQFLDFVSTNNGAYYGYTRPTGNLDGRESTIAVGLLCRMYMGWPKEHPGLLAGVKHLSQLGPSASNLYYSYYGTQVMRHHGGEQWEKWNKKMRDDLIAAQEQRGHAAGSWRPTGSHGHIGGRLYQTSLATMILEVYYRHMPLYSERSAADDFEI
ncbi:MAG: terpene cyclase/mutase family protein, partial [Planctomycetales bacterium]|nr:terpene cyclase/mutase family protein [Planctomycetales bacterium]